MLKPAVIGDNAVARGIPISLPTRNGYEVMDSVAANSTGVASVTKPRPPRCSATGQVIMKDWPNRRYPQWIAQSVVVHASPCTRCDVVQMALQRGGRGLAIQPFNAQADGVNAAPF
jgi:hypothetical protein